MNKTKWWLNATFGSIEVDQIEIYEVNPPLVSTSQNFLISEKIKGNEGEGTI